MTEDTLLIPDTNDERRDLFETLEAMLIRDFGRPNRRFQPFNVADVAHQGLAMIRASYDEFEDDAGILDPDEIATRILAQRNNRNPDRENLQPA